MSARTGLGPLEVAALLAIEAAGGAAHPIGTVTALELLDADHGLAPRYAFPMLVDLAAPWRMQLPLLRGIGNWGSEYGDPPAQAQYTEVQLTAVGALATAAERGQVSPIPLGLIEGTWWRGGLAPSFDPASVLDALATGAADAGPPALPTGGTVDGNIPALLRGDPVRLLVGSTIVAEPGALVVTEVPFGVRVDEVEQAVQAATRAPRRRGYADYLPEDVDPGASLLGPVPVIDVRNESSGRHGIRVVAVLDRDADPDWGTAWLRSLWPVTVEVRACLPAPMRRLLHDWDRGDGSGLDALAAVL